MSMWRIIPDRGQGDEVFIPMDVSKRAIAILDRTIDAYKTGEIATIAAEYLIAEGFELVDTEGDEDPDE